MHASMGSLLALKFTGISFHACMENTVFILYTVCHTLTYSLMHYSENFIFETEVKF